MIHRALIADYIRPIAPLPTDLRAGGKPPHGVRCVLFDIYGTLFISASGDIGTAAGPARKQQQALLALLESFGIRQTPSHLLRRLEESIRQEHRRLRDRGISFPEVRIERIWMDLLDIPDLIQARRFAVQFECIVNPTYPMPHLPRLLSACRRAPVAMGMISNAQFYTPYLFHWHLGASLTNLGFDPQLTLFSHRWRVAKPSTTLFVLAAKRLKQRGIEARNVVYVGNDMRNDIYPAAQTGFMTALFAGDRRSLRLRRKDPLCHKLHPDLVITDLSQLITHLP